MNRFSMKKHVSKIDFCIKLRLITKIVELAAVSDDEWIRSVNIVSQSEIGVADKTINSWERYV
ncbi:MAG: hypothetical protein Q8911_09420 [Bacillota bacterium]|nr:hypothetical protein [Bacillota bacterium]